MDLELFSNISIHAPRVGSDLYTMETFKHQTDFYPRSPRGERRSVFDTVTVQFEISIHAPRVGSDLFTDRPIMTPFSISIHAPRVGSDRRVPR